MSKVVGIDLGTTYSAIAYINKYGKPEIIPNRDGERITPSVVLFDEDTVIVGSIAKRSAVANPLDTVQFVKRRMGDQKEFYVGDKSYTSEEISAFILKRLKEDAEISLGGTVSHAVITVPAYFDDAQRKATQDAGQIAGLNVLRIINEPTAAALAYGLDNIEKQQTILVYDLGGGTFDVTLMHLRKDGIEVIATDGDKNLGGFDWDNEIMKFLNEEFQNQGGPNLFDDPTLEQDLRDKAEMAKKTLSTRSKTKVFLSAGGKNADITLTLEKFQEITQHLLEKTRDTLEIVLEDAKLSWKDVDKVLLVGGSTRMKAVPVLIEQVTGQPSSGEVHPDEAVAIGAALQGALLQIQQKSADIVEIKQQNADLVELQVGGVGLVELQKFQVKDVNSHSMGVISVDSSKEMREVNSIVLPKNTAIPCKVSGDFFTVQDQQALLRVQVTEGEDSDPKYVKILGEGIMPLPSYPKNSPLEVVFEYDSDGIVHVTVFDLVPRSKQRLGELKIKRTSNLDEQEVKDKQQKLSGLSVS